VKWLAVLFAREASFLISQDERSRVITTETNKTSPIDGKE